MTLKTNIGQRSSPTSGVDALLAELDRDAAERHERREFRKNFFIKHHGDITYGANPRADNCLNRAFKREISADYWRTFVSLLGGLNEGDINECIYDSMHQNRGEHPWQLALRRLEHERASWKNIITILSSSHLDMLNLCDQILDVFEVPHKDEFERNNCVKRHNPVSDAELDSTMSSLANGKEPEENDDHNNSELLDQTSPPSPSNDDVWAKLAAAGMGHKPELFQQVVSSADFNETLPSYRTELSSPNNCYAQIEAERGSKNVGHQSLNPFLNTQPTSDINKVVNGAPLNEKDLWKLPHAQHLNGQPVSINLSYHEDAEKNVTASPYHPQYMPLRTGQNVASTVATTMAAVNSPTTTTPQLVIAPQFSSGPFPGSPASPGVQYIYIAPYMSLQPYYSTQPQLVATSAAATNAVSWTPQSGGVLTPPIPAVSPLPLPYIVNGGNLVHCSNVGAEGYQPSTSVVTPANPSSGLSGTPPGATARLSTNSATNPFFNGFNANSPVRNDNWSSLPVTNNVIAGSATVQPAHRPSTSPASNHAAATGAVSLPNMNDTEMAVFLTYSNDAQAEANILKQKLKRHFRGIHVITHNVLNRADELGVAERIDRVFHNMDYVIPIISTQYLEDVTVTNAANSSDAGAIRCMYVKCLNNFLLDGSRNLKVRALRLPSVPYERVKYLPTCMSTARVNMEELIQVLQFSRNRTPGNNNS